MRILTFTTLYPSAVQPAHGVFVENRLRFLLGSGRVEAQVMAPVPWFPSGNPAFGSYAEFARIPQEEIRHGIRVTHPRYPLIPKVGMSYAPALMYAALRGQVARLRERFPFDLIDAHYFYPDGVAAAMLAGQLGVPFTITARGTDLNLIPDYALPRRQILWAAERASGLVTVCQALKDRLVELGVPAARVRVLRNGVDLSVFRPIDRRGVREELGLSGSVLLSVGHLVERKGHHLVIEALRDLPDMTLLVAGSGPDRSRLESQARALGVADRVRFLGRVPHDRLAEIYSAADVTVLASSREGWANVLLESMACGTPVVATAIWGTPEVVAAPEAGILVPERTAAGLGEGIARLLASPPDRKATRRYAEGFDWGPTTAGQLELFGDILGRRQAA